MFKNILVAVDGSVHGLKAAQVAGELARSMTAERLWVVAAYDPVPDYIGQPFQSEAIAARMLQAEQVLVAAQAEIGQVPGQLVKEVLEGPPAEAILAVAEARAVDLIVMGTRGLGRLANLLVGSQSQKVLTQAACPVLLVR